MNDPITVLWKIEDKVLIGDGCWEWTGFRNEMGYGHLGNRRAHRVVYELLKGPIPIGLVLDHLCRNPSCVRPDHLEPVTKAENNRRGIRTGSKQTECRRGHLFDEENTYIAPGGWQECRTCRREACKRFNRQRRG